jgi:hypothetical protein
MTFFERTLIQLAEAILAFWAFLKSLVGWIGSGLDAILQPVMSPLLRFLNPLCTTLADAAYKLLSPFPPWVGLALISALAGVIMLVAFRYLSNQAGIARAKDDIKANLLALKLFKDDLRVALRAQARIMWALVRLQRYILVPVLWMALPTMLLLSQMAMRYQWRPFVPGETILLKVQFPSSSGFDGIASIDPPSGVSVEVGPIADGDDFSWRMRALQAGRQLIPIKLDTNTVEKEVVVGSPIQRVSPVRPHSRWTAQLLYPIEPVISSDPKKPIVSVGIAYPELKSRIYGSDYWVLTFFIVSMLTAILLKPMFKVRF